MWLILPTRRGVCFATPDLAVYRDRLAVPDRPVDPRTIVAKFSLAPTDLDAAGVKRLDRSDEFGFTVVEDYARRYFESASAEAGPAKLELSVRTTVPFGRLIDGNFERERDLPAVSMSIIRSLPDPSGGPLTILTYPRPGPTVIDPRLIQLWSGLIVLLPVNPRQFGVVQAHGPLIPKRLEYTLPSYSDFPVVFPAPSAFDVITTASAAVISTLLDRGVIALE